MGVGGFLLGGGLNAIGSTSRYGWGAEQVIAYKMVLADGSFATVDEDQVKIQQNDGTDKTVKLTENNDLWFGLRGAGSSFGIVTEFLYTVHRRPETLPVVIPIRLETADDFRNLENAALNTKRYLFSAPGIYRRYNKGIFPHNLFNYNMPYVSIRRARGSSYSFKTYLLP